MPPDLRDLMERSVAHPPAEPHPTEHVVRRAARARLRHRVLSTGGSAVAVLVVAGVGIVGFRAAHNPDREIEPQLGVVGPVVHVDGAARAVAGRDYDVFSTYTNRNLDAGNGRLYTQVTTEGEVLVQDAVRRDPRNVMTEYYRYGVIAPGSGTVRWLPEPPDATFSTDSAPSGPDVRDITPDEVLWTDSQNQRDWKVDVFHRADGTWTSFTIPVASLPHEKGAPYFPDHVRLAAGRIWFVLQAGPELQRLWSVPEDGSAAPRSEGRVGDWDVDRDRLVWTDLHNTRAARLSVRDLATGETRTYPTRSGARCNQLGLELDADRVVLTEFCGDLENGRDDRVHVVSTTGEQLVTVQGDGVEEGGTGDDFLAVQSYGEDHPGQTGSYVYDFRTKKLLRISTGVSRFSPTLGGGGTTLTWGTPVTSGKGQQDWAATWR